jgi:tetratricopeptide (TPR) repeat protein
MMNQDRSSPPVLKALHGTAVFFLACLLLWLAACSAPEKRKPRVPLAVSVTASQAAIQATQQGTKEYQSGNFEEAKTYFEQAVAGIPNSGEAHYNLGLALYALGDADQARDHFIEAANLAPGDKVIWDSPALAPFGSPDPSAPKKVKEYQGRAGGRLGQR